MSEGDKEVTIPTDPAEAVAESLRTHGARLRQYVVRHLTPELKEWLDPQDVTQDVFVEAFRRRGDFPVRDAEEAVRWLLTIARNRLISLVRQHRALKRAAPSGRVRLGLGDSLVTMLEDLGVYRRTPSRSAAAREFFTAVDDALARIPSAYAEVIRLRHVEGLSQKEAAARMGRTEKAVEALCTRGLAALRVEMRSASLFAWR